MHCISQLLSGLYQKSDVGEIVRAVCQNFTVSCTFHNKKELQSKYIFVLFSLASSENSDEPVHTCSLARASAYRTHNDGSRRRLRLKARPLESLKTSTWAFRVGFCARAQENLLGWSKHCFLLKILSILLEC